MPSASARRRSARTAPASVDVREGIDAREEDASSREDATETFGFTPIGAMRSLENIELSVERSGRPAGTGEGASTGKRARRGTPARATRMRVEATEDASEETENEPAKALVMEAVVSAEVAVQPEEDAQCASAKTVWAPQSETRRALVAPLAHTNGLPPTPAVYNAVPWPSSIPIREKSPARNVTTMTADDARAYATPGGAAREALEQRVANVAMRAPMFAMEPLSKSPKELAKQLAEVKREIAKRQSDAVEVSRILRQLQREEADLFTRAAEIQRHLLESTTDEQPYDMSFTLPLESKSVERIVSLERKPEITPLKSALRSVQDVTAPREDAQPSTSEVKVRDMQPFQKLDVRKALISVDFIDGPGGLSLFTASADDCLRLWAPDSRKPAALIRAPRGMSATTVVSERVVCVGTRMGQIFQIDLATGLQIGTLMQGEHAAPWSVKTFARFGRDSEALVAAAGTGGDIKIWDARVARNGGAPMVMYSHGASEIRSMAFSPDGYSLIAAASNDLRAFDLRMSGRSMRMSTTDSSQPSWNCVMHDPTKNEIITTSSVGDVHAWSAAAPFASLRAVRGACAPNATAVVATHGAIVAPSGLDACDLAVTSHASGDVIARWSPDAAERAPATCVSVAAAGDRAHPYGHGAVAAGTTTGTVVVFAHVF